VLRAVLRITATLVRTGLAECTYHCRRRNEALKQRTDQPQKHKCSESAALIVVEVVAKAVANSRSLFNDSTILKLALHFKEDALLRYCLQV